ncbi:MULTISPECIES: Na/Pi cotransporter family protein [Segatella]|jgi:phosphate:Na+ symporter|uniref:Na/Pi-cotransporter II-like protein n=1 Tax=Segatella copri DSM 18205 TaxID=537011 RepID=D1PDW9_9BACT|nr:Na/Pi cotransporter family protein [Segatella copri]MBS1444163.1 Na/Pi cotransporter family protein [Prevotella sp.]EFB35275.1 putative Na/Pi-cotransporter II-like protein [Segatella copri DSM 18205]MBW0031087.1 Na/Pi cotransporter family protein [Segatella copri]MCF2609813.1 Na/Pi cotransporter family protein [Segatella copri]MCW4096977.1 Na/Pi cotransporter family protein [Segatella copri]
MSIWIFFKLIGALALLMFGMKTMSDSLQKMAGPQLRHVLGTMTTNRLTGILSGMLITAAVQSSTATTVMTVSFVNAGLLTLAQAISVIMGANIGTTLTAWIMSAGFSFNITDFVWPAFFIAIILIYSKKRKIIGDFIFGISFMFLGLGTLRQTGIDMDLAHNQPVLEFFASFDPHSFQTTITFLIIGSILTMCVQSSAAVMAITMILCSTGVLPIYQGIALVMGENIGTTVTSNVAALTANTQARRAAMAHMVFNIFGVLWILCVFRPFIHLVCGWVGYDDMMEKTDPHFVANAAKLSFVLAAFHTTFNLSNTFILVWFIPQIEKLVCKIIRPKKNTDEDDFRLRFIQSGIMKTPEISVLEAQKEIHCFAERIQRMFGMVKTLLGETNEEKFVKLYSRIEKYEGISDSMEIEIAKYLDQVSDSHLSDETKAKIRAMLREISEIESIGDSCFNIARTLNRRFKGKEDFITSQYEHMHQMMELTDNALTQMNITLVGHKGDNDANLSFNIENEINNYRNQLKSQNINDVNNHLYTYAIGTMYMDIIQECEKLGDYVVNVVEARMGVRQHEA